MTEPGPSPDSIKSKDFWFDDGDIVLNATKDNVKHHFRVHRTVLTIASPVFRDIFSMPQPTKNITLPVPLYDDSVEDLEALLGALYSPRMAQEITFDIALGILRLSHKYQIKGLQKRITRCLLEDWPLNRADFLARRKYLGLHGCREKSATILIQTAQQCGVSELLPTAFYEVASAWGAQLSETMSLLSPENVIRVFVGRQRAAQRLKALTTGAPDLKTWNSSPSKTVFEHRKAFKECASGKDSYCKNGFLVLRTKLGEGLLDGKFALQAVLAVTREDLSEICKSCQDWYMDILKNKIAEVWENIPADFDLPVVDAKLYSTSSIARPYCKWPITDSVIWILPI